MTIIQQNGGDEMAPHKVERAVISGAESVGMALENFERRLIDRFNGILEAERKRTLDVQDMVAAIAAQLSEFMSEIRAGIAGLSQQLSEYEAIIPPAERAAIAAMVYRHEEELTSHDEELDAIRARLDALEARDGNRA